MKESVSIIILNGGKDQVLMIKRRDIPVWVLPGGGIEQGETPEQAAVREAFEETGCAISLVRKIAEYIPVNRLSNFTHFFEGKIIHGDLKTGNETKAIAFYSPQKLPPATPPPYRFWIKDAFANRPFIRKPIEGSSYLSLMGALFRHPLITLRFVLTLFGIHLNS